MIINRKLYFLLFVSILLVGILLYMLHDYHNTFYPYNTKINYEYKSSESIELDLNTLPEYFHYLSQLPKVRCY